MSPYPTVLNVVNEKQTVINFFYYVQTKDYIETLTSPLRVGTGDGNVAADIPESVPAWIEFQQKYKSEKKQY